MKSKIIRDATVCAVLFCGANLSIGQTLEAENEDAFVVKVELGLFTRNTPENRHEVKRKGWAFVLEKSKAMGCTHLGGISTALQPDIKALLRGRIQQPENNTWTYWTRPNGGMISLISSPQHLVDFSFKGSGFACSRGQPTTASKFFKDIATLERELRFEELID